MPTNADDIDSTDRVARAAWEDDWRLPSGESISPLKPERSADGTRTKLRAAPPPIPTAARRAPTLPPPLPPAESSPSVIVSNSVMTPLPPPDPGAIPSSPSETILGMTASAIEPAPPAAQPARSTLFGPPPVAVAPVAAPTEYGVPVDDEDVELPPLQTRGRAALPPPRRGTSQPFSATMLGVDAKVAFKPVDALAETNIHAPAVADAPVEPDELEPAPQAPASWPVVAPIVTEAPSAPIGTPATGTPALALALGSDSVDALAPTVPPFAPIAVATTLPRAPSAPITTDDLFATSTVPPPAVAPSNHVPNLFELEAPYDGTQAMTRPFEPSLLPTQPRIDRRLLIGGAAGLAVLLIAIIAVKSGGSDAPATSATDANKVAAAAPKPAEAPKPDAPKAIAAEPPKTETAAPAPAIDDDGGISISSVPSGATVTLVDGGKMSALGTTPVHLVLDPNKTYDVILTMDGHPTHIEHVAANSHKLAIVLDAKQAQPVATQPAIAAAAPRPTPAAPVQETPRVHHVAPQPQPARAEQPPAASGTLSLTSRPACAIVVDGRATGKTTPSTLALSAGSHTVLLVNKQQHLQKTVTVRITAGQVTKVLQSLQ